MPIYETIYQDFHNTTLKNKLKPIICPNCEGEFVCYGECETCLRNRAYNREYLETHSFVFDKCFRGYHNDEHNLFKVLPLRLPTEHPRLYYGIELEVEFDNGVVSVYDRDDDYYDDENDNWEIQADLDKFSEITDGMFVYERDGSLDNGVELISRPTSYAFWTHQDTVDKLEKGLEFLRSKGALIKQPDSNGFHIHLSRKFFNSKESAEDRRKAFEDFDWLFQKFQPELERLGGRKYTSYCASKADKLKRRVDDLDMGFGTGSCINASLKCKIKKGGDLPYDDHYSSVNLRDNTIEARVFKSTTDYKEVLARIEIVRNFAHTVRDGGIEQTLASILHTKDNKFLDEHISKVSLQARKANVEFDLNKVCDDEVEVHANKKNY